MKGRRVDVQTRIFDGTGLSRRRRGAGRRRLRRRRLGHAGRAAGERASALPASAADRPVFSADAAESAYRRHAGQPRGAAREVPRQGHDHRPLGTGGACFRARLPHLSRRLSGGAAGGFFRRRRTRRALQPSLLGHRGHPRLRRGAYANRQIHRLHLGRQRVSGGGARGRRPRRNALPRLPHGAQSVTGRERRRTRDCASLCGRARLVLPHGGTA